MKPWTACLLVRVAGNCKPVFAAVRRGSLRYVGASARWISASLQNSVARRAVIEAWRREYNEERPKKSLGGLTPAQYAKQLAIKVVTIPENSKAVRY
jgi:transposase InsO family protein